MPEKFKIPHWTDYQHYKDRCPPWIKLHRCVMRNPEWVSLTDAQRGQLVGIWLLAADHNGVIPASPCLIRKLCHMDADPDIQLFISLGFIYDASMTPEWRQDDANTTCQTRARDAEADIDVEERETRAPAKRQPADRPNLIPPDLLALGDDFLPELAEPPQRPSWDQVRMLAGKALALKTTLNAFCLSMEIRVLPKLLIDAVLAALDAELNTNGKRGPKAAEVSAAKAKRDERRDLEAICTGIYRDQGEDEARAWLAGRPAKYRTDLGLLIDSLGAQAVQP